MNRRTHTLLAALIAGALTSVSAAPAFAQSTSDAPTHADKKAAKKQAEADRTPPSRRRRRTRRRPKRNRRRMKPPPKPI